MLASLLSQAELSQAHLREAAVVPRQSPPAIRSTRPPPPPLQPQPQPPVVTPERRHQSPSDRILPARGTSPMQLPVASGGQAYEISSPPARGGAGSAPAADPVGPVSQWLDAEMLQLVFSETGQLGLQFVSRPDRLEVASVLPTGSVWLSDVAPQLPGCILAVRVDQSYYLQKARC